MKKLFFFFAAAFFSLSVLSCSSDDDDIISEEIPKTGENKGTLTVTIDGILTTFNTVIVNETGDGEYSVLKVVATQDNNPNEVIIFEVIKGNIGMNNLNPFTYVRDNLSYVSDYYSGIKAVLKVNNANKLIGLFQGEIKHWDYETQQYKNVTFTEGTFDISYGYAPDPIIEANSLTVTINDVPRTFNTIIVNETKIYDGRTLLKVTAIRDNNLSEIISFETYEGSVGMNQIQYFTYIKNNVSYKDYWSAIKSVVQANSNRKLTGSFNGEISNWDNASQQSNTIKFTEGSFKIAY